MTHIAVTTSANQLVTIDMPMQEQKRITVRESSLVVENREFMEFAPYPASVPAAADEPLKPVVIPTGSKNPPAKVKAPKPCDKCGKHHLKVEAKMKHPEKQQPLQPLTVPIVVK